MISYFEFVGTRIESLWNPIRQSVSLSVQATSQNVVGIGQKWSDLVGNGRKWTKLSEMFGNYRNWKRDDNGSNPVIEALHPQFCIFSNLVAVMERREICHWQKCFQDRYLWTKAVRTLRAVGTERTTRTGGSVRIDRTYRVGRTDRAGAAVKQLDRAGRQKKQLDRVGRKTGRQNSWIG